MDSFEKKNFWLYAIGKLVSLIGSGIQMIAIPLYILDLTGSGTMTGIFTLLNLLPSLVMAPFAGVLGDRWNRKKIMVNMDFARGLLILFLAFMAITDNMSIYILFICQVFISLMDSLFSSSTQAMLPELVTEKDLMRVNSILGSINSTSMIIGPVLGGIIYGFGGIKIVFLLNGISFIVSAVSELFIKYNRTTDLKVKISPKVFLSDFKEGFKFIRSKKSLLVLLLFFCVGNFLISAGFAVVVPYALRKVIGFSAKEYGIITSTFTVGLLFGNIVLGSLLTKKSNKLLIRLGMFGMTFVNIFFAFTLFPSTVQYFGGASFALFSIIGLEFIIMGFFNALLNTPIYTNFQKLIPNNLRSRVFSVMGIVTQGGVPLGAVIYGVLLDLIPVYVLYMVVSILLVIRTSTFLLVAPEEVYEPEIAE